MVKMEWDREDYAFICVSAVVRLLLPVLMYFIIYEVEVTGYFLRSLMKTPFSGHSLSYNLILSWKFSKSLSS
jgi:hypothetical protein